MLMLLLHQYIAWCLDVCSFLQQDIDDNDTLISDQDHVQGSWHAKGDFDNMAASPSTCVSTLGFESELVSLALCCGNWLSLC